MKKSQWKIEKYKSLEIKKNISHATATSIKSHPHALVSQLKQKALFTRSNQANFKNRSNTIQTYLRKDNSGRRNAQNFCTFI